MVGGEHFRKEPFKQLVKASPGGYIKRKLHGGIKFTKTSIFKERGFME
jgi:hypothetical protein